MIEVKEGDWVVANEDFSGQRFVAYQSVKVTPAKVICDIGLRNYERHLRKSHVRFAGTQEQCAAVVLRLTGSAGNLSDDIRRALERHANRVEQILRAAEAAK